MKLTFRNVGKRCTKVNLDNPQPLIDLSDITFFEPFALVYLGMFLRSFTARGKSFLLQGPSAELARDYLARQNFWERFNFDAATIQRERLRRFATTTSLNDIVDVEKDLYIAEDLAERVAEVIQKSAVNLPPGRVAAIVAELVQNFVEHSGEILAAFMVQYYPNLRQFSIAIGDCGRGIRASLSSKAEYGWLEDQPHHEAVLKAFEPGVSRKSAGGTGFYEIIDAVLEFGGQLRLATGDEYVIVGQSKKGNATKGKVGFDLPGVQIEVILPERQ